MTEDAYSIRCCSLTCLSFDLSSFDFFDCLFFYFILFPYFHIGFSSYFPQFFLRTFPLPFYELFPTFSSTYPFTCSFTSELLSALICGSCTFDGAHEMYGQHP